MTLTIQDVLRQNSLGYSEGFPAGVPTNYNWYQGWSNDWRAQRTPPADFTAVTGWGQVYQKVGEPAYTNPNARVEVANARTYVHLKSTGEWVLVQNQPTNPIAGGHFVASFAGNGAISMPVTSSNGTASFAAPPSGYNDHFWNTNRGTFRAGDVDAVHVQMDMRVTDPNLNLIADVGADWWRNSNAPYLQDHSNNPGVGSSNWVELTTEWRTLAFTSSNAIFQADPPPGITGSSGENPVPPVVVDPTPTTPTTPSPTPQQPTGDNLLVNGSFEATSVRDGGWSGPKSISGWTALSGSSIELWNNHNGVRATNGSNFGELDYLSARDGLYQTVTTQANRTYNLSFDARTRPGVSASTTTIEVLWNDRVVASVPPGSNWSTFNFTVTGTGGNDRLTFREAQNQSADGLGALYDNVRLVASGSSAPSPTPTQPATGTNLLVNGSFEATAVASNQWGSFDTIQGWRAISGGTIELWNNLNGVRATQGSNFGELDYLGARDGLYQNVSTDAGQRYALSFDARTRPGLAASTCTIEVLWNDTVVARVPPGSDWSRHSFTVTGTGGQDRLTFREAQGQGGDGLGALYDNVSLVAVSSSASTSLAAVTQMDRAMDLVTQYSATSFAASNVAPSSVYDDVNRQQNLSPTLTQPLS